MLRRALLVLIVLGWPMASWTAESGSAWRQLFDGTTLDGWVQRGGKSLFAARDGILVGTSVKDEPNSFLCTKATYKNFILELEFKVDPEMNSGVQIRSESRPDYRNGVVHGYQVEIDPAARAWTGGIYDEQRRLWLYDLRGNELARRAFKAGEWNLFHVEAIGPSIRTWLNGIPAANLEDSLTPEGFIALQVHKLPRDGVTVVWRNIRLLDLGDTTQFPPLVKPAPDQAQARRGAENEPAVGSSLAVSRQTPGAAPLLTIDVCEAKGSVLHINGRTGPGATVTVNGRSIQVQDGRFVEYITLDKPGKQSVVIRAIGADGGHAEQTRTVDVGH